MVRDWEELGGLRSGTKVKLVVITLALVGVTVAVAGSSLPLLILVGVLFGINLLIVLRLPTVSEAPPAGQLVAATA
jgi:hypothetical protein